MSDPSADTPAVEPQPSRRSWAIPLLLVAVALVAAVGIAGLAVGDDDGTGAAAAGTPPLFVDETTQAGVEHVYAGDFEFFVGGGVAVFDCDEDGRPELYFAGGTRSAALYRNTSSVGGPLRFERHTSPVLDLESVTGAYPLDVDSDGTVDLAVLRRGENVILRGLGGCDFEPVNDALGVDGGDDWTTAFSATWEETNRLPTLAFGNYLLPDETACDDSHLVRPSAAGDAYESPVPLRPGYCTLSVLFSDWSRTGRRDLRMTNDRHYYSDGNEQLWRIVPGEAPREYTEAEGWRPLRLWGMGIASQDLTGDGRPEVFLTSQGDNKLQTLDDGSAGPTSPAYRDIALRAGVTAQRPYVGGDVLPSTAWHPEFADVNNDGFLDLFVTKGNVEAQPDHATRDPNNLLIGQTDGTFVEEAEAAGIVGFERSRGAALADLNLDGMLDLVVVNRSENVHLWRNVGTGDADRPESMGRWIALKLRQNEPNGRAIGAWVEVTTGDRTVEHEVTVGGGHAGGQAGWLHVGLGDAEAAEIRVEWPDGEVGSWTDVGADQFVTIERGATDVVPFELPG